MDEQYTEDDNYLNGLDSGSGTSEDVYNSPTMFSPNPDDNLVKWQLDIKEELQRIERLIRRQKLTIDDHGNERWKDPETSSQLFNEKGINDILNWLNWYLNKNIILSNFSEDDIKARVEELGLELNSYIYCNYESIGLDTEEKRKHYPSMVLNIINSIEASYLRALNGGERDSLRTARSVHQTESGNQFSNPLAQPQKRGFSLFDRKTW